MFRLFHQQLELMEALGIESHLEEHVDVYHPEVLAACIGLASEALEILDELNVATRPWAVKPTGEVKAALAREAIDVLFYFIELMIFLRVDSTTVCELYEEKWDINMERIRKGEKDV